MASSFPCLVAVLACLSSIVQSASVENQSGITDPRIIGGVLANSKEAPYVAQLRLQKDGKTVRYCGAARLNQQWFLTAAECLDQTKYDYVNITYPADLFDKSIDFDIIGTVISKLNAKKHPDYDSETKANNLAIIKYEYGLTTDFSRLAALPQKNLSGPLSFKGAVVASWSILPENSRKAVINQLDAYVLHPILCNLLHLFKLSDDKLICTSGTANKRTTENDVGAPLLLRTGSNFTLIGIATSYQPTAIFSRPMIFTKVYPYIKWIYRETGIIPPK